MYKVGLSSCGFSLNEESFVKLEQGGIEAIEICMAPRLYPDIPYREIAALSRRYHVALWSYHLPFWPFSEVEPSSPDPALRKRTVSYFTDMIERAADIGISRFVVHPSGEPIAPEEREERLSCAMESLDALAEIAHRHGAVIAVEDLPRTCLGSTVAEMVRLICANDKLRVCFDTNHLLQDTHTDFIRVLGDRIVTLHVSDYDFTDEKHWLPGEGSISWQSLLAALAEVPYRGVWMYELSLTAPKTLTRSRDLSFADFRQNADALFAGETPKRIL